SVVQEGGRIDRVTLRCQSQRALRGVGLVVEEQRTPIQRQDATVGGAGRGHAPQGLQGLAERFRVIVLGLVLSLRLRDVEPELSKRSMQNRLIRSTLERIAQREDRKLHVPGARVCEADGHLSIDVTAVQARKHLQLLQFVGASAEGAVDIGELLSRRY